MDARGPVRAAEVDWGAAVKIMLRIVRDDGAWFGFFTAAMIFMAVDGVVWAVVLCAVVAAFSAALWEREQRLRRELMAELARWAEENNVNIVIDKRGKDHA